jgi:autotransporter-associated beta strand protein
MKLSSLRSVLFTGPARVALGVALVCAAASPTQAQNGTRTWTGDSNGGGGVHNRWSTGANWVGGVAPITGDALIFSGTKRLTSNTNNFSDLTTFSGITFDIAAGAFTLSGNPITLGGTVTTNSTNTQTIDLAMALSASRTFNALAGDLVVRGVMSGAGGLAKTGGNTLTLTAANTYTGATTIAAGTLQLGNGGTTGSLSTSSSISNNGTLAFNRSNTITQGPDFASVITGTGGITKLNTNTLVLNGTNTYTGATTVNAGTLRAGAAAGGQAFGNLSALTMANTAGATLDLNGFDQTIGSLAGGGTTGGNVTIGVNNLTLGGDNSSTLFGGAFTGTGNLTKVGNGTFTVTSQIPSLVTITISAGTLQIGNGGTTGQTTSPSTVINNATYVWDRSANITHGDTSVISGTGVLVKRGSFTFTMNSTNSYSGGTVIDAGTIALNNALALGSTSGTLTVNTGGTLNLNNFSIAVGNLTGTGGTITSSVGGSRTLTIGTGDTGGGVFNGVIADGAGTTSLTKVGTGTITLTGVNTYSGSTTVNAGTLRLEGLGSINSSFPIIVAPGATLVKNSSTPLDVAPVLNGTGPNSRSFLRGNGRINAAMTTDSIYNVISPGDSPGTLSYGEDQSWESFTYAWEVNNWESQTPATNFDIIDIDGGLDLTGTTAGSYALNVLSLTASDVAGNVHNFAESNKAWTILTTSSGITGFNAAFWTINAGGFTNSELGTWSLSLANGGNDLVLTYSAVPEPPMMVLLAAAGIGFAVIRRRRSLVRS